MSMNGVKPLSPDEVSTLWKNRLIPDGVIQAFNSLIQKEWKGGPYVIVKQDAVVEQILINCGGTRQEVFDNHWLDVEEKYRCAGWKVTYDKPGYDESYEPFFKFERQPRDGAFGGL